MSKYIKNIIPQDAKNAYHAVWYSIFGLINSSSPELATKLLHFKNTGKWIDLENPRDFNEKLQWLKLNEDASLKAICADKYELYEYVRQNYTESILNKLVAVYETPDEIDWDSLPDKCAIKCTHGCGYNIVTKNKSELDVREVRKTLDGWLKEDYWKRSLELHYRLITPRIIVEEYIETEQGDLPLDYKIYCFNGVPKLVLVCSERESKVKLDFFDLDWNRLNIGHKSDESNKVVRKPSCFDEMILHAEALAKPFTFVRADFYDKDGVPVFGELTFTPAANMAKYYNAYGLVYLGGLLNLP